MADDERGWVTVETYGAVYLAEIAKARLESAGIPAHVHGEHTGVFGPGWAGMSVRGVELRVPRTFLDAAREVLDTSRDDEDPDDLFDDADEDDEDEDEGDDEPWRG